MSASPWHRWFAADWLSSETRHSMSAAERGLYRDALDLCYLEGSIPADKATLQRLLAATPEEFSQAWPAVAPKFEPHPDKAGRLINRRAFEVLAEQADYRRRQAGFGRKGGRPRKGNKGSLSKPSPIPFSDPGKKLKPHISPKGDMNAHLVDERFKEESFAEWWTSWVRKQGKADALKAYREIILRGKVKPDERSTLKPYPTAEARHTQLMKATAAWRPELEARPADRRPYPATFLRRLDWLDEPAPPRPTNLPAPRTWESDDTYQARMRREGYLQ